MAIQEHVDRILKDVDEWNRWRFININIGPELREVDLSQADLRRAELREASLSRADLCNTDLREADLHYADLKFADLSGADLSGASLFGADLTLANLSNADLSNANLHKTDLFRANLSQVDFSEAVLYRAAFEDTNLSGAMNLESCRHAGPSPINYRTLENSGMLPTVFLRGCGMPEKLIDYYPSLLNQAISYYSCFISYSHADKSFARRLHDALQGRGIRCWLDEHELLPGDDIYDKVSEGIRVWDKVLLCSSKDSLTSWWVDNEIDAAFEKEQKLRKQKGKKVLSLIPLNLDGYLFNWEDGKAPQVRKRLAADFTGWENDNDKFETEFEKVVKALMTNVTPHEKPPESKL